jgi:imidazolonepropionase-like amidohydrolase
VRLGVDSIEHGIFLDEPTLASMAARGVAWTPTLRAVTAPLPADAPAERRQRVAASIENMRTLLPVAVRLGAPTLEAGARGDVVTYDADPRDDPTVLAHPRAIVLNGQRVR